MENVLAVRRLMSNALLACILLAAQLCVTLHAFEHESGAPQTSVCKTCVAADQLAAASVDDHRATELEPPGTPFASTVNSGFQATHALTLRQRGPPLPR